MTLTPQQIAETSKRDAAIGKWLLDSVAGDVTGCAFVCGVLSFGKHSAAGFGFGGKVGIAGSVGLDFNRDPNSWSLYGVCDLHAIGGASVAFGANLHPDITLTGSASVGAGADLGCAAMLVYTW